jgi:hypothetical protein
MYYTNYKKRNGDGRNRQRRDEERGYFNPGFSYRKNSGRFIDASAGRSWPERYDNERYESRHRNHGGYYEDDRSYHSYRNRDDDRNFFERAGDRIREGWNNMMHDDDHDNDYLKSRYNRRQAGYDNGDYRNRPSQDEEYGYHHQRATYGYEGDNRTYNDNDYDRRYDEYERRRDGESNRYNANSSNDDYYTGYREFDRNAGRRDEKWRGRFAW